MRRAKFCRCSSAWRPGGLLLLDPNSPAQASLRTVVVPGGTFSVFHGPSWADPPARRLLPGGNRMPHWKKPTLPAPLTSGSEPILPSMPEGTFFRIASSPAGGDRSFHPFLNLLVVADFPVEAGTSVPITMSLCASIRVAQSGKSESCPVDNGDIADRIGTSARLPFRSRRPTSHACPNPLP